MGHVPQHNAMMFETVSSVGARQGPIITVQEGHTFLAILILFKKKTLFSTLAFIFAFGTEQIVHGKRVDKINFIWEKSY